MNDSSRPTDWRQIAQELRELTPFDILDRRVIYRIEPAEKESARDAYQRQLKLFRRLGEPFEKDIDAAIAAWLKGRPLELPSIEHRLHFLNRVIAALRFAESHTMLPPNHETPVFSAPACSPQSAVSFLLTAWWYERGYIEYFHSMLLGSQLLDD